MKVNDVEINNSVNADQAVLIPTGASSLPPDPFDPKALRLSQDFAQATGVKKALLTVPVRKPSKEWWVRTHPDESYRLQTMVLELKEDREIYLVNPELWSVLATESTLSARSIITAVNRQGLVFLWPIRLPGLDGKIDDWNRAALDAAQIAMTKWVRVAANMSLGAYDVTEATADLPEPEWPKEPFNKLLHSGFKDRYINDLSHPVLSKLRGEV